MKVQKTIPSINNKAIIKIKHLLHMMHYRRRTDRPKCKKALHIKMENKIIMKYNIDYIFKMIDTILIHKT